MSDLDYEVVKIRSISHYLNILTKKYPNINENSERFYRGLSSEKYVPVDYPSIYRKKDETYDPYIKYEDKIFHDVIAKSPEDFRKCENTFEHLVKMQHYGTPTRLLDVTSNPLIALYFACTNGDGSVSSDKDGAIVMYDIPKENIKNYDSDTVTLLANIAKVDEKYRPLFALLNLLRQNCLRMLSIKYGLVRDDLSSEFIQIYSKIHDIPTDTRENITELKDIFQGVLYNKTTFYLNFFDTVNKKYLSFEDEANTSYSHLRKIVEGIANDITFYKTPSDIKFENSIKQDKPYFNHEKIIPEDLTSIFCVKPKLNNPRIINQNGAFLIFGFSSLIDTKLTIPTQHFKYKPLNHDKNKFLHIKISKNQKKKLINELRLLGIDRAFIYPEIENIAKVITDKYTIQKTEN